MRTRRFISRPPSKISAGKMCALVACIVPILAIVPVSAQVGPAPSPQFIAPPEMDLSSAFATWGLGVKSQRRRDTCAVFTITGALEYGLARSIDDGVPLSEEYLNWAANDVSGDWSDGATFSELQRGFSKWGISEDADMPYQRTFNASYAPTENAMSAARQVWEMKPKWNWIARDAPGLSTAHIAAAKRVLARGWPVAAGGEHCMLIVAYMDNASQAGGGMFLMRDYATSRNKRMTYAEAQRKFDSLLWIQFPQQAQG